MVFSGERSRDLDGQILSDLWHFGDHGGGVGKKLAHTFARVGSTVRDSFGQMAATIIAVRVGRPGPVSKAVRSHPRRRRRRKG